MPSVKRKTQYSPDMSYTIKSFTGSKLYEVQYDSNSEYYTCTCPDFIHRRDKLGEMCKHIEKIKELDDLDVPEYEYNCNSISVTNMELDID